MLTQDELKALERTGELATLMGTIIGVGGTRQGDIAEMVFYIHGLQRMIMSQSAAREYPQLLRGLGGVIHAESEGFEPPSA